MRQLFSEMCRRCVHFHCNNFLPGRFCFVLKILRSVRINWITLIHKQPVELVHFKSYNKKCAKFAKISHECSVYYMYIQCTHRAENKTIWLSVCVFSVQNNFRSLLIVIGDLTQQPTPSTPTGQTETVSLSYKGPLVQPFSDSKHS